MRIHRAELRIVRLPLIRPFRTSSSVKDHIQHVLVRLQDDHGIEGWGECASPADPYYCPETTETCWHILKDFLLPSVVGIEWETIDDLVALFGPIKGNGFARAGLEMACWDLLATSQGKPLHSLLGGTRSEILSGVSLGIEHDFGRLFEQIEQYLGEGYLRIKLKIGPGYDVDVLRRVRERWPSINLQVDANSAYTLADIDIFKQLDAFDLLLIEQPLAHDDIIDHARLQSVISTPVCLDESIHSAEDARKALELDACRTINIKVSRVGGLREAKRIHDLCFAKGIPVWCGGMHEFGIGRAANVAIASLPGFTLPGDVSGSDKYYAEDIVEPPIVAVNGAVRVPSEIGLGHHPRWEALGPMTRRIADAYPGDDGRVTRIIDWPTYSTSEPDKRIKQHLDSSFHDNRDIFLDELGEFVGWETPSRDKASCDAFALRLVERFKFFANPCEIVDNPDGGNHVLMRWRARQDGEELQIDPARKPGLILAHYDTVWPLGTTITRPFQRNECFAYGPGVYDMKASLLLLTMMLWPRTNRSRNIIVLITSDEEIGSPTSRSLIEKYAREAEYVLVLEPPLPDGSLKTARKGVGGYTLEVTGKSAHAGVEPEKGANAILELSHQILKMQALNHPSMGTTLNVGTIQGGTTPNVVPDRASCRVDVRASTLAEAERIDATIRGLTPFLPGTSLTISGGFNRPPMERTPAVASLFERAREIGRTIGMELTEGSTGGGSDGNFTASLGVPTLDGLGVRGGGAHAENEHIVIDSIPERATLLAALLASL